MKKIALILFSLLVCLIVLLLLLFQILNQEKPQTYKIGILNSTIAATPSLAGFKEGMSQSGFIEGEIVEYLYSGVFTDPEELQEEAGRLVDSDVDLIYSMATGSTLAAQRAVEGSGIPIVFGPVSDPIGNGIVTDLKQPDRNSTGVMFAFQEEKRLGFLKEFDPAIEKVLVPYNPEDSSPVNALKRLESLRKELGLEFIHRHVRNTAELDAVLQDIPADIDAIFIPTDPLMAMLSGDIARAATQRGLLTSSPHQGGVANGVLYSYSFEHHALGVRVAHLAVQILEGEAPGNLPVEVSEFALAINLTTAGRIDLEIPDTLMRQAVIFE